MDKAELVILTREIYGDLYDSERYLLSDDEAPGS
jgi:hypothetical protein